MEAKRHPVNLKQYRKVNGKWQFVAVARDAQGNPDPRLILLNNHSVSSKGGTFYLDYKENYLDYKENGKRRQAVIGSDARQARETWRTKLALLTGETEPDPESKDAPNAGQTIDAAIASFLTEVKATKGVLTGSLPGCEMNPVFEMLKCLRRLFTSLRAAALGTGTHSDIAMKLVGIFRSASSADGRASPTHSFIDRMRTTSSPTRRWSRSVSIREFTTW